MERRKPRILRRFLSHQLAFYNACGIFLWRDIQTMGLFKVFRHGFWHHITKTRVLSCFMPRGEQVVSAPGCQKRRVLRGFMQHRTENLIFLCDFRVGLFSATKSRKHRFSRGFTPHGSENLVFYVGLMHPRYFHNRMSKASFFCCDFCNTAQKHRILRGFGADPIFLQQGSRNTVFYELFCNVAQKTS